MFAYIIARHVRRRRYKQAGALLANWPRLYRLVADALEEKLELPPHVVQELENPRKIRRLTSTGEKISKAALRALDSGEYTIAAVRKGWEEIYPELPCPADFTIRDFATGIGAPLFDSKRGRPKGSRDKLREFPGAYKRPRKN